VPDGVTLTEAVEAAVALAVDSADGELLALADADGEDSAVGESVAVRELSAEDEEDGDAELIALCNGAPESVAVPVGAAVFDGEAVPAADRVAE
jgi:hypothetical protein